MSEERRRFTRVPFKVKAKITINQDSYMVDKIKKLSVGGWFLPLVLDCKPKTACHVKISLTGSKSETNPDGRTYPARQGNKRRRSFINCH